MKEIEVTIKPKRVPFSRLVLAKSGAFSSKDYPREATSDETVLWRAVIDRAMHDLGSENNRIRQDAEDWFDVCNEDFVEVCRLADIFPKEVLDFIKNNSRVLRYEIEETVVYDITIYLRIKRKIVKYHDCY